jgi:hypothetical protein
VRVAGGLRAVAWAALAALAAGCGLAPVYPPRPPATTGEAIADPSPSRIVVHATVASAALTRALDEALPRTGQGTFPLLGGERGYTWRRAGVAVRFVQGRIGLDVHVDARADLPLSHVDLPLDVHVLAEPVVTSDYVARLQSTEIRVTSNDRLVNAADALASVLDKIKKELEARLAAFSYDLRPMVAEAHERIARPLDLPLGDAQGCAKLDVLGIEAGPTVLADGIEKDLALVVAPSITLPCGAFGPASPPPPLANVAALQPGPFVVGLAIAARYEELARAMSLAFTDGKLFFSKQFPGLYLDRPEVYPSGDLLVLKLHVGGPVKKLGFETTLDGDLFLAGHPRIEDNELRVPDLEPTIETSSLLLQLEAALDGRALRDQARAALRLDLAERLGAVRSKLSSDLAFGEGQGCLRASVDKIEVTGLHAHAGYLRMQVAVTGRAAAYLPCPSP